MDPTANRYTLPILREKRARVAGEIADHQLQIRRLERDLEHLDAVLLILDPGRDPTAIKPLRHYRRVKVFKPGDLGRLIVGALRRSDRPMGTHEIAACLGLTGSYGSRKLSARVRANLAYLAQQKRVKKIGSGRNASWTLADCHSRERVAALVA